MDEKATAGGVKTSLGRLVTGMVIGQVGLYIALITPITLLLTLKFMELNPNNAAAVFGTISGLGALFAMFANPIGGAISDRTSLKFGRRRTWILLGSAILAICLLGIGFSSNYLVIGVLWCLAQISANFVMASITALVPDQVDEARRGSVSGIIGLINPLGIIIGLAIMTAMGNAPMITKWIVLASIGICSAIVSCILIKEGKVKFERKEKAKFVFGEAISKVYPSPRKYPAFTWGWLTRFFISLAYGTSAYNSMMLMQRFHYSQTETTSMTTLLSMVGILFLAVSSIFGGMLSDKLRKQKPFVALSALVVGIGLIFNAAAPSFTFLMIGNALAGLGYGIYMAVDMALISRILPSKNDAAKDFGIMNIANTATQSIVPFIGPSLLAIGSWPFFFGSLAVGGVFSALCVIPIPEMSSRPQLEAESEDAPASHA